MKTCGWNRSWGRRSNDRPHHHPQCNAGRPACVALLHYTLTVVGLFRHVASGEFEEAVDMVCAAAGSLSRELGYHA